MTGAVGAAWRNLTGAVAGKGRAASDASEQFYNRLIANHCGQLISTHTKNGETLFASLASESVVGCSDLELMGSGFINKLHLQDRIVFLKAVSDVANDSKERSVKLRFRSPASDSSSWRSILVIARRIEEPSEESEHVVCTTTDMTEVQEQEIAINRAIETANELDEDKRRFLATMSHELRTPLNAIIGFADILDQGVFGELPNPKHREHVSLIKQSGEHLLGVVNDVLDVSRLEAGKYELSYSQFAIEEVVTPSINMLNQSANSAGVALSVRISENLPEIYADRRSCQQILINIISNAIKFTPSGGRVSVDVCRRNEMIEMQVTDNGIGIDESFIPKLGQPFVQAESRSNRHYEGTGLGLSIVKGLLDLHGGNMKIESGLSEGTKVSIALPLKPKSVKPVPFDDSQQLVRLQPAKQLDVIEQEIQSSSEGEYRERVSA